MSNDGKNLFLAPIGQFSQILSYFGSRSAAATIVSLSASLIAPEVTSAQTLNYAGPELELVPSSVTSPNCPPSIPGLMATATLEVSYVFSIKDLGATGSAFAGAFNNGGGIALSPNGQVAQAFFTTENMSEGFIGGKGVTVYFVSSYFNYDNCLSSTDPSCYVTRDTVAVSMAGGSCQFVSNTPGVWTPAQPSLPPLPLPSAIVAKTNGNPANYDCGCVADPINVATGNVYEEVTDYETAGPNRLRFARYYNSFGFQADPNSFAIALGKNWRSNYDRYLQITNTSGQPSSIAAERADGQVLTFALVNGVWVSDRDVNTTLTQSGSVFTLRDGNDNVETYSNLGNGKGQLSSIVARGGYTQNLTYTSAGQLDHVTDMYGRVLKLTYQNGLLQQVTTPDGLTLTYGYGSSGLSGATLDRLASVTYSTVPSTSLQYVYEDKNLPLALTGVIDENGNRFSTWGYDDATGRAISNQRAGGAGLTTISYDDTTGNRTVTNALGQQSVYKFQTIQGAPKVVEIDRLATSTTAAATQLFTFDGNGYLASQTDWDGNLKTYINNAFGRPTTIAEAANTPDQRVTAISYDPTFISQPGVVTTPGLTTKYGYDANGNLKTKTETDTTGIAANFSPADATSRTWTYNWQNAELASILGPRTDVTQLAQFGHDVSGALTSITDPLGHVTKIKQHTPGGYPQVAVDANGIETDFSYYPRMWLYQQTVVDAAGNHVTTHARDNAGQEIQTILPDGSAVTNSFDAAHRYTGATNLLGETLTLGLDALGNIKTTTVADAQGHTALQSANTYNALGQLTQHVEGNGQTTTYTPDPQGNVVQITDPRGNVTLQGFDHLNRRATVTDANKNVATTAYDAHDRITHVTDPNGNSTRYFPDGFGRVLEQISPDTGETISHYDPADNLTQRSDNRGAVTLQSFDAGNRLSTRTFPGNPAENVTFTYDQTGFIIGPGVGKLTSVTDAAGATILGYNTLGEITVQGRFTGSLIQVVLHAYNLAGREVGTIYPYVAGQQTGLTLIDSLDAMGNITTITAQVPLNGTTSNVPVVSNVTHQPFGGPVNGFTYGNGINHTESFDLSGRPGTLTDSGSRAFQHLTYAYYPTDSVQTITDAVTPGNSQSFTYDALDRLSTASGNYGSRSWTFDANGNRLAQSNGNAATALTYGYVPGTNQLKSISSAGAVQTAYGLTPTGNIGSQTAANGLQVTFDYNQDNRLADLKAAGNQIVGYGYDYAGQRVVKTTPAGTTLFEYDPKGLLLSETDQSGGIKENYIYLDGTPVAASNSGQVYYLHTDRLGTPQLATNGGQAVVWTATYDPYGAPSTLAGAITQNLRLPGQEFDPSTLLYHNGERDYYETEGRYIESDRIGLNGGLNTYAYAGGNPVKFVDPRGTNIVTDWIIKYATDKIQSGLTNAGNSQLLQSGLGLSKDVANYASGAFADWATGNELGLFKDTFSFAYPVTPLWNGDEQAWLFDTQNQRLTDASQANTIGTFLNNGAGLQCSLSQQPSQFTTVPASPIIGSRSVLDQKLVP
jgi:RHS repeat-associated protein